jgi:hypothetical protein
VERIVVGLIREEATPERCERILAYLDQRFTVDATDSPFVDVTLSAEDSDSAARAVSDAMTEVDPDWPDCFRFGQR